MTKKTQHNFELTATDKTKGPVKSVKSGFSSLGNTVGGVAKIAGGAVTAVVGAAAAAGAALGVLASQSFKSADAIGKFSDRIGISSEKLVGLRHAAEQTAGMTGSQLDVALQRMTRRVSQAAQGTGEAVKVLDELGLSAQELKNKSPDQQFAAIADAMKDVDNQGDRVRLTFGLFDSEGVALVNTLKGGSEGLNAFNEEATKLGIALERGNIAKIEAANDALDKVKKSSVGVGNAIAVAVAPMITGMANLWVEAGAKTIDWGKASETVVNAAVKGVAWLADYFQNLLTAIKGARVFVYGLGNAFAQLFAGSTQAAASFLNFFASGLKALVIGSLELIAKLGRALAEMPGRAGDAGSAMVSKIEAMQSTVDNALTFDGDKVAAGIKGMEAAYNGALTDFQDSLNQPKWSETVYRVTTNWKQDAETVAETVRNTLAGGFNLDDVEGTTSTVTSESSEVQEKLISQLTTKLATVESFLATEEERILTSYQNREQIIAQSLENGLISEETAASQLAKLNAKKEEELTKIALKGQSDRDRFAAMSFKEQAKNVVSFLTANTGALAKESKTWFKINKGLSIAEAAMNTYQAITKTLASYPAPWNFGLAAVVAANGWAQINQIRSTQFNADGATAANSPSISSGISAGSYASPVDPSSALAQPQRAAGGISFVFNGDFTGLDESTLAEALTENLKDKFNNGDLVLFESTSRQAREVRAA